MSYTVLARKWRPQNFQQLVGQEHVQRAIVNAIDQGRMHHAYLFTGTRGVGKTTIARIFSKCLNCQSGITSQPCGECDICQEIEQGHFVDLMEIDAASRTKVEDTREILDNVQYRPTRGRYKVYLIDEVHMLSNSSFNALLKTLEEPPPHVIFLLATTDPQKLPVTVLSRCLQFHLKRMTNDAIAGHLINILKSESIEFDEASVAMIAQAADGSMRDSLSLLDQAIAFGGGKLKQDDVGDMLGAVDQKFVYEYLMALAEHDAAAILSITARMSEFAPDYQSVLAEIISTLHQLAVAQLVGEQSNDDRDFAQLMAAFSPQDIQLFYQLATHARKDLPLSPDLRQGFEMALLRMLAFRPAQSGDASGFNKVGTESGRESEKKNASPALATVESSVVQHEEGAVLEENTGHPDISPQTVPEQKSCEPESEFRGETAAERTVENTVEADSAENATIKDETQSPIIEPEKTTEKEDTSPQSLQNSGHRSEQALVQADESSVKDESKVASESVTEEAGQQRPRLSDLLKMSEAVESHATELPENVSDSDSLAAEDTQSKVDTTPVTLDELSDPSAWHRLVQQLNLSGSIFQVLNNSRVETIENGAVNLQLLQSVEHFVTDNAKQKIVSELESNLGAPIKLNFEYVEHLERSPKEISEQNHIARLESIKDEFKANNKVASLLTAFSADLTRDDIQIH